MHEQIAAGDGLNLQSIHIFYIFVSSLYIVKYSHISLDRNELVAPGSHSIREVTVAREMFFAAAGGIALSILIA